MSLQFYIPQPQLKQNARTLSKGFGLPLVQRAIIGANNFNIKTDPADATSYFGTPVYDTLFIQRPEYTSFEYNEFTDKYVQTADILDYNRPAGQSITNETPDNTIGLFLNGVVIDATVVKNIIKTDIIDHIGTVKEYINQGDIELTIRGYVASKNPDEYPDVEARLVKAYASAPVALKVTSVFLNEILNINNIVVDSLNMMQQQGMRNVQYFQLNCTSTVDYTISTKKNV